MVIRQQFRVHYFLAAAEDEGPTGCLVHERLRAIKRRDYPQRTRTLGFDDFLLGDYAKIERDDPVELWAGEIRRLRTQDRVAEGDHDGLLVDIELEDGHFVSECSYFLVVPTYRCVLYHSTFHSATWTQFRHYVNAFAGESEKVLQMGYVPDKEAVRRFNQIREPRKFALKVAHPYRWTLEDDPALKATSAHAGEFAEWLRIEVSAGRGGPGLPAQIKDWLIGLVGRSENSDVLEITEAKVEGYESEDGGERLVSDLVEAKLQDKIVEKYDHLPTIAQYRQNCVGFLVQSWDRNRSLIRRTLRATQT